MIGAQGTLLQRFESVRRNPDTPREIFIRLLRGDDTRRIADEWDLPPALFGSWVRIQLRPLRAAVRELKRLFPSGASIIVRPRTST